MQAVTVLKHDSVVTVVTTASSRWRETRRALPVCQLRGVDSFISLRPGPRDSSSACNPDGRSCFLGLRERVSSLNLRAP